MTYSKPHKLYENAFWKLNTGKNRKEVLKDGKKIMNEKKRGNYFMRRHNINV